MSRPLIGITSYFDPARWGTWVREAVLSPPAYTKAVDRAGGAPVLIPPLSLGAIDGYVRGLSGVILAGGVEVDPAVYGEERDERVEEPQPGRDRFEIALAAAAIQAGVPVLGVARGMHVLNVALGGTLIPWLPDAVHHERHAATAPHVLQVSVSSKVGKALGDRVEVAMPHHQGLRRLGDGLIAVAWADDQIIEAVELQGHRFCVGVQWHTERGDDNRLVDAFVEAAMP
ncbi:gamma-glutamyl-gamma-aminobutyrate hydrolase [Sphaerisporangium melleum]|uniref:Gamma-glutamyl-gamma-aminobutyrate hydrolase n=1 Tax=Sphaerisporangium melleum TaxID=321316 RepID=A0A917R4M9_9ACTN|nr:gamma-glutamyl-gamma-aminobutyrate hydrolase family protein [Sphaerisporangium melleum]GGK90081.1 gamma-glutamyl-gamma-aminobutyrate hydrolase [Sphaerisporangium melleum]GII72578.1 gamma-glutamyl-gamma-aminobutyrate hydrolase [Sphaerisporangium melleum]